MVQVFRLPVLSVAMLPVRLQRCRSRVPLTFLVQTRLPQDDPMQKKTDGKKQKCKNCEGKGTLKKGDKVVRCQRCGGSGIKR